MKIPPRPRVKIELVHHLFKNKPLAFQQIEEKKTRNCILTKTHTKKNDAQKILKIIFLDNEKKYA